MSSRGRRPTDPILHERLLQVIRRIDPVGLGADGPADEYAGLADDAMWMLKSGAPAKDAAARLEHSLARDWGLETLSPAARRQWITSVAAEFEKAADGLLEL